MRADDVVTRRNFLDEHRDIVGIVLQIAIHGDDVLAARVIESSGEARGLSEIAAQLHNRHSAVHRSDLPQHGERLVARAVIDENDLKALAIRFHDRLQTIIEVGDVLLLVMQRYDDGVFRHSLLIIDETQSRFPSAASPGNAVS